MTEQELTLALMVRYQGVWSHWDDFESMGELMSAVRRLEDAHNGEVLFRLQVMEEGRELAEWDLL